MLGLFLAALAAAISAWVTVSLYLPPKKPALTFWPAPAFIAADLIALALALFAAPPPKAPLSPLSAALWFPPDWKPPGSPKPAFKLIRPPGPLLGPSFKEPWKSFLIIKSISGFVIYANSVWGWLGADLANFGTVTISDGE